MSKHYFKRSALDSEGEAKAIRITELQKQVESHRQVLKALQKEEAEMLSRIENLKQQKSQGLILLKDVKRCESDIRQFSEELAGLTKKREVNSFSLSALELELNEAREKFAREVFVLEILEPAKREPQIYNAVSRDITKVGGAKVEVKEILDSKVPTFITVKP